MLPGVLRALDRLAIAGAQDLLDALPGPPIGEPVALEVLDISLLELIAHPGTARRVVLGEL